jgi:NitT/TauT family transport system substrate-binding protein
MACRRFLSLALAAGTIFGAALPAAWSAPDTEVTDVRVAALKGPTGIGIARLLESQPSFGTALRWSYSLLPSPQEMVARVASRELDVAVLPANTAAKLYTDGPKYRMGAVVGWGVLYLVSRNPSIRGWSDLKGKELLSTGRGATPDYLTRYLLHANGLEADTDVRLNFGFGQEQIAQLLLAGRAEAAVLPEPFASLVLSRSPDARIVLDLQEEFSRARGGAGTYPISVVVIGPRLFERDPEAVERFLGAYQESIRWVNANVLQAAALVAKLDIMAEDVARSSIPRCNLDFVRGPAARAAMEAYLGVLLGYDAASVGGHLPDERFYLTR